MVCSCVRGGPTTQEYSAQDLSTEFIGSMNDNDILQRHDWSIGLPINLIVFTCYLEHNLLRSRLGVQHTLPW